MWAWAIVPCMAIIEVCRTSTHVTQWRPRHILQVYYGEDITRNIMTPKRSSDGKSDRLNHGLLRSWRMDGSVACRRDGGFGANADDAARLARNGFDVDYLLQ